MLRGRTLLILSVLLVFGWGTAWAERFSAAERRFLVESFQGDFKADYLERVFNDSRLERMEVLVKRNIHNQESGRDYEDFKSRYSLWLAKKFKKKWRTTLANASREFDVDPEVVVAILLVETGFGNVMGKYPVIGVFSSILVEHRAHAHLYPVAEDADPSQAYFLNRLEKKAQWAQGELKALLTLAHQNEQSPYRYKGSYAGAFGLPQFLPSSYLKWGFDSDQSGTVNLFWFPDAIYSTANYLKSHGWKRGLHHQENERVVWHYNRSRPYVETVLEIAKILRQKSGGSARKSKDDVALNSPDRRSERGLAGKKYTDKL